MKREGWSKDAQTSDQRAAVAGVEGTDQGAVATTSEDSANTNNAQENSAAVDAACARKRAEEVISRLACADSPPAPAVDPNTATDHGNNARQSELLPYLLRGNISSPIISLTLNREERIPSVPGAYHIRGVDHRGDDDEFHEDDAGDGGGDDITGTARAPADADIEVEAYTVPDDDEQEEIIDRLHLELGSARQELDVARTRLSAPVVEGVLLSTGENGGEKRRVTIIASILLLSTIAVVVVVSIYFTQQSGQDDSANPPQAKEVLPPVLETLKERGVLRCGVNPDSPSGFSLANNVTGVREGFEIDFCRAVAAASLGSSYRFETIVVTPTNRFLTLQSGEIDLLLGSTTHTFERDVHEASTGVGFSFSAPYLYGGLTFNGVPEFVSCADDLNAVGECANLMICVIPGTTWMDVVKALFPGSNIVSVQEQNDGIQGLIDGICNVIVGEQFQAPEVIVRSYGYKGAYAMGKTAFSKEPLALVTRDGDPEFADFVNWVLQGLLKAEEQNVTSQTADTFSKTSLFGDEYENMFQNALAAVGNYGEIYSHHLEHVASRLKVNMLNKGDTGLLYSHPFGNVDTIGPGPIAGGVIERIIQRGFLRCGVTIEDSQVEMISGTRVGLDIEFCRAISATIFKGKTENISFKRFPERYEYRNISSALEKGDIDVYAGGAMHMSGDVQYPGLSFSKPYLFEAKENSTAFKAHLLVAKDDDAQWTDHLYWVIMASFYAEEEGIEQKTSNEMPLVNLYGPNLERVLRDNIFAVGNYGEMHRRVFGQNVSRVGRNLLNIAPFGPQHNPLPFGNHLMD